LSISDSGALMPASLPPMINKWVIVILRYPRLKPEAPVRQGLFPNKPALFPGAFFHRLNNQYNSGYRPDVENHRRPTFRTGQHADA
jgi:hypothetical protein